MEEFLAASRRNSSRRRRLMRALGAMLTAEQHAWEAKTAKGLAEQRAWEAETAGALAEQRAYEAQRARDEAEQSRKLAEHLAFEAAVTANDSAKATVAVLCRTKLAPMHHAGDMAFKVLREMLARLPGEVATFPNTTVLDVGRSLLQKPWHYTAEVLQGHAGFVTSVAMSPDGRSMASESWDRTLRVWQLGEDGAADGGAPLVLRGHAGCVTSVAWAPDGRSLACGSHDAMASVWRLGEGGAFGSRAPPFLWGHIGPLDGAFCGMGAWRPRPGLRVPGRYRASVAGVGEDDAVDGSTSQVLRGNIGTMNAVASAPDGRSLASGSREATVRVWRVGIGGAVEGSAPHVLTTAVHSVVWARDGRSLASGSGDYTARVWRVVMDSPLRGGTPQVLQGHTDWELRGHTDWVFSVAWAPDGRALASGSRDATVRVWWVGTNGAVEDATFQVLRGHTESVTSVAWAPNGRFLASGYLDASVRVWRVGKDGAVETGNTPQALQGRTRSANPFGFDFQSLTSGLLDCVTALAWAPDSRSLAAGSDDNTVRVWRVARTAQRMAAPRNCCTATLTG
eukprot:jgi/Tetstr1/429194/TSEL_019147.t1